MSLNTVLKEQKIEDMRRGVEGKGVFRGKRRNE
jgi:hypothetical protein